MWLPTRVSTKTDPSEMSGPCSSRAFCWMEPSMVPDGSWQISVGYRQYGVRVRCCGHLCKQGRQRRTWNVTNAPLLSRRSSLMATTNCVALLELEPGQSGESPTARTCGTFTKKLVFGMLAMAMATTESGFGALSAPIRRQGACLKLYIEARRSQIEGQEKNGSPTQTYSQRRIPHSPRRHTLPATGPAIARDARS